MLNSAACYSNSTRHQYFKSQKTNPHLYTHTPSHIKSSFASAYDQSSTNTVNHHTHGRSWEASRLVGMLNGEEKKNVTFALIRPPTHLHMPENIMAHCSHLAERSETSVCMVSTIQTLRHWVPSNIINSSRMSCKIAKHNLPADDFKPLSQSILCSIQPAPS